MTGKIQENLKGKCFGKTQLDVGITGLGLSIYLMGMKLPKFLCTTQKSKQEAKKVAYVQPIDKPSKTILPSEK